MSGLSLPLVTDTAEQIMTKPDAPKPTPPGIRSGTPRVLESSALFDRHPTVTILHQGEQYILRRTAGNKLILTK